MAKFSRILTLAALLLSATAAQAKDSPWFGTWKLKLTDPSEKPETLVFSDAGKGAMRMVSVEDNSIIVTHFDGRPAKDIGSAQGVERTLAIKAVSPRSYSWTFDVAGKPRAHGINTLASDGWSFTEVAWPDAQPAKTINLVYERQR